MEQVRARVMQSLAGSTGHDLEIWDGSNWIGSFPRNEYTSDGQWLTWTFNPSVRAKEILFNTKSLPSWVAW